MLEFHLHAVTLETHIGQVRGKSALRNLRTCNRTYTFIILSSIAYSVLLSSCFDNLLLQLTLDQSRLAACVLSRMFYCVVVLDLTAEIMLMTGNPQWHQTVTFLPKWKCTEIARSQRCRIFSRNILICMRVTVVLSMCSLIFCANHGQVQVGNRFRSVDNSRYLFAVHEGIVIQTERIRSPNTTVTQPEV